MNNRNDHQYPEGCIKDIDCAKCKPKHPKPKEILLECGEGNGSRIFTSSEDNPFQLAHVTVDNTCVNKAKVLIKFSSLVEIVSEEDSGIVRLQYELFKVCDGNQPLLLGTWEFEKDITLSFINNIEESFNFTFCECIPSGKCSGCCEYLVIVTPLEISGDGFTATVKNGQMAALAQTLCDTSREELKKDAIEHQNRESDKIMLACGKGTAASQITLATLDPIQLPINVAQVTVDTTCLNKPKILIEFSSIIETDGQNFRDLELQFQLFRVCGDGEQVPLSTWRFKEVFDESIPTISQRQKSFSFIYCECFNIPRCCVYFVKVTPVQLVVNEIATWKVYNTQINAYAQSSSHDCYRYDGVTKGNKEIVKTLHPKPKRILLECGGSTGCRTFTSSSTTPFQLAFANIDTTEFCKPVVNIEFSSTLAIEQSEAFEGAIGVQLQYELFRVCDGGVPISIGTWKVDRLPIIIQNSTETFNFVYCDCTTCPGCCDYFVAITLVEFIQPAGTDILSVTVRNGRIAASAQEG